MTKTDRIEAYIFIADNYTKLSNEELAKETGMNPEYIPFVVTRMRQNGVHIPRRKRKLGKRYGALDHAVAVLKDRQTRRIPVTSI